MKLVVVSYSHTGNNNALAEKIADRLDARHVRITESKKRSIGRIALDMLFNRAPRTELSGELFTDVNEVPIFVAPVWMGKAASPLRRTFSQVRGKIGDYSFVSISGGADGPNTDLEADLVARLGKSPATVVDLHIANLLPPEPAPARKDTMHYRLSQTEIDELAERAVESLRPGT